MNITLINPPVYFPTTPPYSLAALKAELKAGLPLNHQITALDLNAKFHKKQFKEQYEAIKTATNQEYFKILESTFKEAKILYSKISKGAYQNTPLEFTQELVDSILKTNPYLIAFSVAYNSQIFLTKVIIKEILKFHPHKQIVIGGPADYSIIIKEYPQVIALGSAQQLITHIKDKQEDSSKNSQPNDQLKEQTKPITKPTLPLLDFSDFPKEDYFSQDIVYPIRTSIACPYGRCTFCTHHGNKRYEQFDLTNLKEIIQTNNIKKIAFIDDDLTPKRLQELADILGPLEVTWWCQLRPIKNIQKPLIAAAQAGLTSVAWGVESANQRVLNLIDKGTNPKDIQETLALANELNIKNQLYLLFGFPTETKEEFEDTINFLKHNQKHIHLVSPSIFGLQFGSKALASPELFDIKDIQFEERTLLSPRIHYKTSSGLTQEEVKKLKKGHNHTLNQLNKVSKIISIFKEQILNVE